MTVDVLLAVRIRNAFTSSVRAFCINGRLDHAFLGTPAQSLHIRTTNSHNSDSRIDNEGGGPMLKRINEMTDEEREYVESWLSEQEPEIILNRDRISSMVSDIEMTP